MGSSGSRSDVRASSDRSAGRQQQRRRQDAKLALNELKYYHMHVGNSEEAMKVLDRRPVGSFILRNCSGKHKGFCAVSVVVEQHNCEYSDRILRHFDISLHNGSFFFERKRPFKTLQALVDYYGKHDVPNSRGIAGVRLSIPFEKPQIRPMRGQLPLPADARTPKQVGEESDMSLQSQQPSSLVYCYACCPDRTDNLITYFEQQQQRPRQSSRRGPRTVSESSSASGRCACGIMVSDAALPRGWTIHQNVRERVIFYKDAGGVSHWVLPQEIDRLLSGQQRDFIELLNAKVRRSGKGYGGDP